MRLSATTAFTTWVTSCSSTGMASSTRGSGIRGELEQRSKAGSKGLSHAASFVHSAKQSTPL